MPYLHDPRVLFAAERTLLAWQRTSIALIGLGFVVERFGIFLRIMGHSAGLPTNHSHFSLIFGVGFLIVAACVAVVSAWQFHRFLDVLGSDEIPSGYLVWPGTLMNVLLAIGALAMVAWFLIAG